MNSIYSLRNFLYFSYMFRCLHHHQEGEQISNLLKTRHSYKAVKYIVYRSNDVNTRILQKVQLCICWNWNSCTAVKFTEVPPMYCLLKALIICG
jgi:hypothetical protein